MNDNEILEGIKSLMKERDQAIAERTPHDYGFLKTHIEHLREELHKANLENRRLAAELERVRGSGNLNAELSKLVADMNRAHAAQVSPEPSRLEIAAMFYAAEIAAGNIDTGVDHDMCPLDVLDHADSLIAAAKAEGCSPQ
jgi:hypothetical protein